MADGREVPCGLRMLGKEGKEGKVTSRTPKENNLFRGYGHLKINLSTRDIEDNIPHISHIPRIRSRDRTHLRWGWWNDKTRGYGGTNRAHAGAEVRPTIRRAWSLAYWPTTRVSIASRHTRSSRRDFALESTGSTERYYAWRTSWDGRSAP
jgi:hypothetical protein